MLFGREAFRMRKIDPVELERTWLHVQGHEQLLNELLLRGRWLHV
jgi:hypothetical protein